MVELVGQLQYPVNRSKRVIRLPRVLDRTGLSRSGIYQKIKKGQFPAAIPLGERSVGWLEAEVDDWIEKHIAMR